MSLTLLGNDPLIITTYDELGLNNSHSHQPNDNDANIDLINKEKFDSCLIQAIDEVFTSLGPAVNNEFFEQINRNFKLNNTNIPDRIEDFAKILHRVFGLGANRLELKILQVLKNKMQAKQNMPECDYTVSKWIEMEVSFIDTLSAMKSQCLDIQI
jgi:hypothetical protein